MQEIRIFDSFHSHQILRKYFLMIGVIKMFFQSTHGTIIEKISIVDVSTSFLVI